MIQIFQQIFDLYSFAFSTLQWETRNANASYLPTLMQGSLKQMQVQFVNHTMGKVVSDTFTIIPTLHDISID